MKCPTCRRRFDENTDNCSRCGTDLTDLVQLDKQVNAALRTAKSALKHGNPTSADKHLQKLQTIRPEDEVPKARALAALMKRDFNAALAFYRTVKKHDGAGE